MKMSRARVLVIEDEIEVAATLLEQLTGRDYEVVTATTAEESFDIIDEFRPDVLLLDLSLPGLSGPGLLTVFARVHPALPVIVVTSVVDPRTIAEIAARRPFHVVYKPYDIDALDRLVAAATEQSRAQMGRTVV
jgi:DNA-binding NtrC family response regulator